MFDKGLFLNIMSSVMLVILIFIFILLIFLNDSVCKIDDKSTDIENLLTQEPRVMFVDVYTGD